MLVKSIILNTQVDQNSFQNKNYNHFLLLREKTWDNSGLICPKEIETLWKS